MAVQNRHRNGGSGTRQSARKTTHSRKRAILAILMLVSSVLIFLALVSYNTADEANADIPLGSLLGIFTGDPLIHAKADTTQNWLGLIGAMISEFLIKSTVGYSVFCFPFLLGLWGWTLLRKGDYQRAVTISNYTLVFALLFATGFGMGRLVFGNDTLGMGWSGAVGDFLAGLLARLIGKAGGSILILAGVLLTVILAADLDVHQIIEWVKARWLAFLDWNDRRRDARLERRAREEKPGTRGEEQPPGKRPEITVSRPDEEETPKQPPARTIPFVRPGTVESVTKKEELQTAAPPAKGPVLQPAPAGAQPDEEIDYVFPSVDLLAPPRNVKEQIDEEELKANAELLRSTLAEFDVELESVSVTPGPVVTLYELVPASGVKISRIVSLENDMALKLAAKGIRIMAPIPGKSAVGVEIPNSHRALVTMRSVLNSSVFRDQPAHLPIALGKTISGEVFADDLAKMPHLLIAGSTGSGKSVGINTILASLFFRMHPSELKLVIVDPKKIEMAQYAKLKHHFLAVSPDADEDILTTPANAVLALRGVEFEMERRYDRLASAGVRNIVDYNERVKDGRLKPTAEIAHSKMPYLLVVIDELADLMITAAREVEEPIARLAQLARAVGIHLVVATQRPSVDVITGVIKANFSARIAYQVASKTDSRTILDMNGAEQLLGNGDMLYLASGTPKPIRLQNAYISPDEVDAVVDHISRQQGYATPFMLPSMVERKRSAGGGGGGERDELFEEAAHLIVRHQQGSVSLLQRRLKVGYSRAARLVDELEAAGIVGPFDGSKARAVLVESEEELDALLHGE
jgi:S-DNA-T family DNA segregation ATPase FtsK/SpoIIIE